MGGCIRWTVDTERAFLSQLRLTGRVDRAAAFIGRSPQGCNERRKRRPDFAAAWDRTLAEMAAERLADAAAATAADGEPAGLPETRTRHDGWTLQRQHSYARALGETGSHTAAAARVGMSRESARRARGRMPSFAAMCAEALHRGAPSPVEAARQRAMDGWDEPVFYGGKLVGQRRRYSDSLLRFVIAQDSKKPAPALKVVTSEQTDRSILRKLSAMTAHRDREAQAREQAELDAFAQAWGPHNWMKRETPPRPTPP